MNIHIKTGVLLCCLALLLGALTVPGCETNPAKEAAKESGVEPIAEVVPEVPAVKRDAKGFEVDPPGAWYRGDVHVHSTGASNDTGGDSLPKDIAAMAQKRGLDFVVMTDHSNSTGSDPSTRDEDPKLFNKGPEFPQWEKAAALSVPGKFLLIAGNEISPVSVDEKAPRGHIGCLPQDLTTFDRSGAFTDRPRGDVSGGDALAQAKKRGCFSVLNHPYAPAIWITYDWKGTGYDAMEVWNGGAGFDLFDKLGVNAWRCDLLKGRSVTPIGASDNHRVNIEPPGGGTNPALGWPSTSVFATELTWPAIIKGLKAGHVALHEGESFLQIDAYDGDKRHTTGKDIRWLRLRGKLDKRAGAALLTLQHATACEDPRPKTSPVQLTEEDLLAKDITPGESFDVAFEIKGALGVYTALLKPPGVHYVALSRAFVIK